MSPNSFHGATTPKHILQFLGIWREFSGAFVTEVPGHLHGIYLKFHTCPVKDNNMLVCINTVRVF